MKLLAAVHNISIDSNTGTTIEINTLAITTSEIAEQITTSRLQDKLYS
jgi:hypothetical protein